MNIYHLAVIELMSFASSELMTNHLHFYCYFTTCGIWTSVNISVTQLCGLEYKALIWSGYVIVNTGLFRHMTWWIGQGGERDRIRVDDGMKQDKQDDCIYI